MELSYQQRTQTGTPVERRVGACADDGGFGHEDLFRWRVCGKLAKHARNNNKTK